jgi:hypothetical protein
MAFQYMPHGPVLGMAASLFLISVVASGPIKNGPALA